MALEPEFDPGTTEYTTTTTDLQNKIVAEAKYNKATVTIEHNDDPVDNEDDITWDTSGGNVVTITVSNTVSGITESKTYTITVIYEG